MKAYGLMAIGAIGASIGIASLDMAHAAVATQGGEVKSEVLVKSDKAWNGKPYERYADGIPQLTVVRITIPAHAALPWHTHLIPNAAYVVSGHLTVEDRETGRKQRVEAGEAFNEQVGAVHRGYTDDEPCTVVSTYAGTPGTPVSVPAAGEKAMH